MMLEHGQAVVLDNILNPWVQWSYGWYEAYWKMVADISVFMISFIIILFHGLDSTARCCSPELTAVKVRS